MSQHTDTSQYVSPLSTRYASSEMQFVFSQDNKFRTWRKLWIALARAEQRQGLPITDTQIAEMEAHAEDINYPDALRREAEVRHDVMSHVYAYGLQCPTAAGIIHLGATSCYVGDNADVIAMKQGLTILRRKLLNVISLLADFADAYRGLPALAYTHLQPAQLTTVGKRATLWIHELMMDLEELDHRINSLALLGSKGTTGTQASFVELFSGDSGKIKKLEHDIATQMGFDKVAPVSGQTYSRKMDYMVLSTLSGIAQTASKFSYDLRLLQGFKEMEEPFEKSQIGSSAMPYKRNPMRSERISGLARYVMVDALNGAITAASQWFERTLDDSANRRLSVSEAFLASDAILNLMMNVCDGLVVYPKVIHARVMNELPFMATENILMDAVKRGGNRQELHERLRLHSQAAASVVKEEGGPNDLLERIASDPAFGVTLTDCRRILQPANFIGRSLEQVEEYLAEVVRPVLQQNAALLGEKPEITV
ncbi:MAG: adenylosuccinate lyase [Clostridiales bacterium]|nr:adenylosuccinate lyase [Clostridiales bacterium]